MYPTDLYFRIIMKFYFIYEIYNKSFLKVIHTHTRIWEALYLLMLDIVIS